MFGVELENWQWGALVVLVLVLAYMYYMYYIRIDILKNHIYVPHPMYHNVKDDKPVDMGEDKTAVGCAKVCRNADNCRAAQYFNLKKESDLGSILEKDNPGKAYEPTCYNFSAKPMTIMKTPHHVSDILGATGSEISLYLNNNSDYGTIGSFNIF